MTDLTRYRSFERTACSIAHKTVILIFYFAKRNLCAFRIRAVRVPFSMFVCYMALFIGLGWRNGQTNIAQRETPPAGGEAMIQTVTMAQELYCAWLLTLASVLLVGSTVIVGYGNYVALER